jgi:hypothetical protein
VSGRNDCVAKFGCVQYFVAVNVEGAGDFLVDREFARTGWCCQCEGESIAEPGGSASGPWPASAWFGKSCGSIELIARQSFARFSIKYRSPSCDFVFPPAVGELDDHHEIGWSSAAQNRRAKIENSLLFNRTFLLVTTSRKGALHTGILLTLSIESGDDDDFRDR